MHTIRKQFDGIMVAKTPKFEGKTLAQPVYRVNPTVKLPGWVRCRKCGGKPTAEDWLVPRNFENPNVDLIHWSHVSKEPLNLEAGWIARNA